MLRYMRSPFLPICWFCRRVLTRSMGKTHVTPMIPAMLPLIMRGTRLQQHLTWHKVVTYNITTDGQGNDRLLRIHMCLCLLLWEIPWGFCWIFLSIYIIIICSIHLYLGANGYFLTYLMYNSTLSLVNVICVLWFFCQSYLRNSTCTSKTFS